MNLQSPPAKIILIPNRGILFIAGAAISFGLLPIFFSMAPQSNLGVGVQVFARLTIGTAALFMWNYLQRSNRRAMMRLSRPQLGLFLLNGFFLFAAFSTYNLSINLGTSPAKAILIIFLSPIYSLLLGKFLLREKIFVRKGLAILGGITGIMIALGFWNITDLYRFQSGDLFALLNGLLSSFILIIGRWSSSNKQLAPLIWLQFSLAFALAWGLLAGLITSLVIGDTTDLWSATWNSHTLLLMIALGFIGTVLPYILLYSGLRYVEASISHLVLLLEPISVFVLQAVLLGDPIFWWQILGGMILLSSGYFAQSSS